MRQRAQKKRLHLKQNILIIVQHYVLDTVRLATTSVSAEPKLLSNAVAYARSENVAILPIEVRSAKDEK